MATMTTTVSRPSHHHRHRKWRWTFACPKRRDDIHSFTPSTQRYESLDCQAKAKQSKATQRNAEQDKISLAKLSSTRMTKLCSALFLHNKNNVERSVEVEHHRVSVSLSLSLSLSLSTRSIARGVGSLAGRQAGTAGLLACLLAQSPANHCNRREVSGGTHTFYPWPPRCLLP